MCPLVRLQRLARKRQMAGPRLAAAAAGRNGGKRKCDANSTSASRIFQRRQPVAFEHFAPRSETTDEKEFGGWKIPKASNNNRCAPGGRNWEIDGWRKNRRFLFSSSGAAPHRTRHASRETAQHPASFRRFQPSRQAIETKVASIPGNDSARQRQMPPPRKPKIKEERHDPDL